jgi:uncharacterized membrane protein
MSTYYERLRAVHALSSWISGERREEDKQQLYILRRRAWLWRPLAAAGSALLVWQITSWDPFTPLVSLGILMCLPWVCDV